MYGGAQEMVVVVSRVAKMQIAWYYPRPTESVSPGVVPGNLYFSIKQFLGSPASFQQHLGVLLLNDRCRVAIIYKQSPRKHKKNIHY